MNLQANEDISLLIKSLTSQQVCGIFIFDALTAKEFVDVPCYPQSFTRPGQAVAQHRQQQSREDSGVSRSQTCSPAAAPSGPSPAARLPRRFAATAPRRLPHPVPAAALSLPPRDQRPRPRPHLYFHPRPPRSQERAAAAEEEGEGRR